MGICRFADPHSYFSKLKHWPRRKNIPQLIPKKESTNSPLLQHRVR